MRSRAAIRDPSTSAAAVAARMSRRDFLRIAGRHGLTATLFAAASLHGQAAAADLARAAALVQERRAGRAVTVLRFGAANLNADLLRLQQSGQLWFAKELELRSEGALRVEFIGDNRACTQDDCARAAMRGDVDIFAAATQNSAASVPYYAVLDFPYLFPSRAALHHFFYHPASEGLLREPLRRHHDIHFLYSHCELRGLMLGSRWRHAPAVSSLGQLFGSSHRVSATPFSRIALILMGMNPTRITWEQTLDHLRTGRLDGVETTSSAVAQPEIAAVVSQAVELRFMAGTQHTAMRYSAFLRLPGQLQDLVMETAFAAQQFTQRENEIALRTVVGAQPDPAPGTAFRRWGIRVVEPPPAALKEAEERCAPHANSGPWKLWRERLNRASGGRDVYEEIRAIAGQVPANLPVEAVRPRRWWQNAALEERETR